MAWPVPTYDEYAEQGGTLSEEAFGATVRRASARVAYLCHPNAPETEAEEAAAKAAVCAAVDADVAWGGENSAGDAASVTIGRYSHGGGSGSRDDSRSSYDAAILSAIRPRLVGTSLLNWVVC